jgi:FAD/FMN-containing dehydrogenase
MLLGGFGFQSRLRGLSVDNLVEVEMVLADGRIVIVNETEHPGKPILSSAVFPDTNPFTRADLWFAIRGGGPAFGIVIRYKAKAYPVPVVFAGNLI